MSDRYQKGRNNNEKCITICDTDCNTSADAASEAAETQTRRNCDFDTPVCVDTSQIYDSCRDRDCVANTRVYTLESDQDIIEAATNVKLKKAEIIWVYTNIEPLPFNNGYFSVDMKFYVNTTLEVFSGFCNPTVINGLAMFDKRVILYGSEGNSKIFKSNTNTGSSTELASSWRNTSMPTVVVETVDPIALSANIVEADKCCCTETDETQATANYCEDDCLQRFPSGICEIFDGNLLIGDNIKHLEVSFGLFSIVRLERDTQLLIDAIDFCIPTQECPSATDENPCNLFNNIRFPIDEFFPPQKTTEQSSSGNCCKCGCMNCNCK